MTQELTEIRNKEISDILLAVGHDACIIVNYSGDVHEVHMSEFNSIKASVFCWIPTGPCKKIGEVTPFNDRSWIGHRYQVFSK